MHGTNCLGHTFVNCHLLFDVKLEKKKRKWQMTTTMMKITIMVMMITTPMMVVTVTVLSTGWFQERIRA